MDEERIDSQHFVFIESYCCKCVYRRKLRFIVPSRLIRRIERIVQCYLLRLGKLAAALLLAQAEPAAVIGTPLAEGAVGTRVFFYRFICHQYTTFRFTALPSSSCEKALPLSALTSR